MAEEKEQKDEHAHKEHEYSHEHKSSHEGGEHKSHTSHAGHVSRSSTGKNNASADVFYKVATVVFLILFALLVIRAFTMTGVAAPGTGSGQVQVPSAGAGNAGAGNTGTAPSAQKYDASKIDTSGDPVIGKNNAPVTMIYWYDYQCPYCKRFEQNTLPTLISNYVDKGKLKIVFKQYPFLGQDSVDASLVSFAVWNNYPDKWLKWEEQMFTKQDGENSGWGSMSDILNMTATLGMDPAKLQSDINANKAKYTQKMQSEQQQGQNNGVSGTPGFLVGTQSIVGAQPTTVFTQAIDQELKK